MADIKRPGIKKEYLPPPVLYQQFEGERKSYQDVFFLTQDGSAYVTAEELRKTDPGSLTRRLKEANLPDDFRSTSEMLPNERPGLLIHKDQGEFVAAEGLLPEAHETGVPIQKAYSRDKIFALNHSSDKSPRYFNIKCYLASYMDEIKEGQLILTDDQKMQLGRETRPHAPKVPTTKDHAKAIMEKLGEPKWIASHYPNRPPLLVWGDDEVFSEEGARKIPPSQGLPAPGKADTNKYVLKKANIPRYGDDNPDAGRPVYGALTPEQCLILKDLKSRHSEHLGNLGLDHRWARGLSEEERFRLGFEGGDDTPWSAKVAGMARSATWVKSIIRLRQHANSRQSSEPSTSGCSFAMKPVRPAMGCTAG